MATGPLFPALPEDLTALSDTEIAELQERHRTAIELIRADDQEFLADLEGDEIIAQLRTGVDQLKALDARYSELEAEHTAFLSEKEELLKELEPVVAEAEEIVAEDEGGDDSGDEAEDDGAKVEERELVLASAAEETTAPVPTVRYARTPPAPRPERIVEPTPIAKEGTALVASSQFKAENPGPLDPQSLSNLMREVAMDLGPVAHDGRLVSRQRVDPWQIDTYADGRRVEIGGGEIVWDGPKTKVARAEFDFPEERTLDGKDDMEKIRAVLPEHVQFMGRSGGHGGEALTASGGLCAPLTPLYSMPNFGTEAEPVWDSLPVFAARRGGVNVPTPTYIADITSAISSISEANDALGGTFATKSCQDLTCPTYTETAVNIFAHCREYGNLNARAWPEKIAHENALTMQALARVSEGFMLDRIKSFFPNVTNGATTLGSLIYVVEAIVRARFGIIGRLRMPRETRFRALLPYWVPDILALDTVSTPFERFRSKESLVEYLRALGIDPVFYLDTPSTGTTQLPDSSQTAAAIDSTPANVQWAIYPEGAVLGIDMGTLELGIVRDSVLNSTNDFQVFGERFRNVALLGPAQSGMWVTTTYCSQGSFPPAGTARTCP